MRYTILMLRSVSIVHSGEDISPCGLRMKTRTARVRYPGRQPRALGSGVTNGIPGPGSAQSDHLQFRFARHLTTRRASASVSFTPPKAHTRKSNFPRAKRIGAAGFDQILQMPFARNRHQLLSISSWTRFRETRAFRGAKPPPSPNSSIFEYAGCGNGDAALAHTPPPGGPKDARRFPKHWAGWQRFAHPIITMR